MSISLPLGRRILIVTGHYGSGKTEFAVSLAMALSKNNATGYEKIAVCDLDVVNPYFRSREQSELLESVGIHVYGGIYGKGTTAEIPEISPSVRAPLEDANCFTIIDTGGNDSGARILKQFEKYFSCDQTYLAAVVNASRPETSTLSLAYEQLSSIELALNMKIDGLISNTHMLMETSAEIIQRGYELCKSLSGKMGNDLLCVTYPESLVSIDELTTIPEQKFPLGMYMRQSWLDK